MTKQQASAEVFWQAFTALSKKAQSGVLEKFLSEKDFLEDLVDIAIIEKRRKEPTLKLNDYLTSKKAPKRR